MNSTDGTHAYRYERKFVVPFQARSNLTDLLFRNRCGFHEIFTERTINNVYFDTPLFRFFHENIQGLPERKKVRVRWYGDKMTDGNCRLEIKRKVGLMGAKEVHPLHPENEDLMSFRFWKEQPLPPAVRAEVGDLRPTLFNRYRRRYFLSADGRFRVTIDHTIRYGHPSQQRTGCPGSPDMMSVLELKYGRDADPDASRITADIPLSLSRKSKYVTGICAVYDG